MAWELPGGSKTGEPTMHENAPTSSKYCCFDVGCIGYWLHRKLQAMGIANYVACPRNWGEYGQKAKTVTSLATLAGGRFVPIFRKSISKQRVRVSSLQNALGDRLRDLWFR